MARTKAVRRGAGSTDPLEPERLEEIVADGLRVARDVNDAVGVDVQRKLDVAVLHSRPLHRRERQRRLALVALHRGPSGSQCKCWQAGEQLDRK